MKQSIDVFLNLPSETEVSDRLSFAVYGWHLGIQKLGILKMYNYNIVKIVMKI